MISKKDQQGRQNGFLKIVEAAIIISAVFAAEIALGRIVDVALDAIH